MLRRLIFSAITILSISSASLAISHAQGFKFGAFFILISSYDDDPFTDDSVIDRIPQGTASQDDQGKLMLENTELKVQEEEFVYRWNDESQEFIAFAWNPWSPDLKYSNQAGDFTFVEEPRFPLHRVERGPDGKIVLKDGLQLWLEQDLHRGVTTAFEAAHSVKVAAEDWVNREISWGENGSLGIYPHAFIDFNAFYSPTARALFFGVVPHRLPGQTEVKMFETATSWDIAAHETGHAILHSLKPNAILNLAGYKAWSESFSDQISMWTSLRDADRVQKLIETTNANLNQSNALSRNTDAFGALVGDGKPLRDAFHTKRVSDTSTEEHERSEVLTGALYQLFLLVYREYSEQYGSVAGLQKAADVMGTFLLRSVDFTPEDTPTMDDVVMAYLKVDKEIFDYRYNGFLVDEFVRRELLNTTTLNNWLTHEASIPSLRLPGRYLDRKFEKYIAENLDELGIGPNFGLKTLSVTQERRVRKPNGLLWTIVRVQLTQGRGNGATPLDNYGILVFRTDGTLADWHSPMPSGQLQTVHSDGSIQAQSVQILSKAQAQRLDQHGVPVALVRRPDGTITAEARVLRGKGLNAYLEVFSSEKPGGERREILLGPLPPSQQKLILTDFN